MNHNILPVLLASIIISFSTSTHGQENKNIDAFCKLLSNDVNEDVESLPKKFGKPIKTSIKYYPNKHIKDATDEIHTAAFGNGLVSVYSVPAIERNYLFVIELTKDFWPEDIPNYLSESSRNIKNAFGTPDKLEQNSIRYYCDIESANSIRFIFEADKLVKMRAQKWID